MGSRKNFPRFPSKAAAAIRAVIRIGALRKPTSGRENSTNNTISGGSIKKRCSESEAALTMNVIITKRYSARKTRSRVPRSTERNGSGVRQ